MIQSEAEYQKALRRLEQDRPIAATQREALAASGLTPAEVERAMEPLRSLQAQLEEEVAWYEDVRRRKFPAINAITSTSLARSAWTKSRSMPFSSSQSGKLIPSGEAERARASGVVRRLFFSQVGVDLDPVGVAEQRDAGIMQAVRARRGCRPRGRRTTPR